MPDTPPPAPGAAPTPFHFPFAEAAALKARLNDLISDLEALRRKHEAAVGPMRVDFTGSSRDAFDGRFDASISQISTTTSALHGDVDELDAAIALAHRRQQEYEQALAAWHTASQAYADYQHDHPVPAGTRPS
jgi:hypothetical protein